MSRSWEIISSKLNFIQGEIRKTVFKKFGILISFNECSHSLGLLFFINTKEEEPAMQV